jgi:hypothetical protein
MKLNNSKLTVGEGWLLACEGWMACGQGRAKMWDGYVVGALMDEIKIVHGRLCSGFTSSDELAEARAEAHRGQADFTSEFVRELIISAMGMADAGFLYTRDRPGLEIAQANRKGRAE